MINATLVYVLYLKMILQESVLSVPVSLAAEFVSLFLQVQLDHLLNTNIRGLNPDFLSSVFHLQVYIRIISWRVQNIMACWNVACQPLRLWKCYKSNPRILSLKCVYHLCKVFWLVGEGKVTYRVSNYHTIYQRRIDSLSEVCSAMDWLLHINFTIIL